MTLVTRIEHVLDAIQQVRAGAANFCTNFFPTQPRLKAWIDRGELRCELQLGSAFFFRSDRDFQHLYFSASDPGSLQHDLPKVQEVGSTAVTADLVGNETSLQTLLDAFSTAGFRPYSRILRLSRTASLPTEAVTTPSAPVTQAQASDAAAVLNLIEASFDRYADQLPALYEIEHAIFENQVFVVRSAGEIAALVFFETQGLTSVVRYWVVTDKYRSHGFGSILMRHYWQSQAAARRFILWVRAANDDALSKYRHYGYAPDGLVDHVMANHLISSQQ